MAGLIRLIFGIVVSAFVARIVEGVIAPKGKGSIGPTTKPSASIPTVDLKPCPVCGVYTAQPAVHCKTS